MADVDDKGQPRGQKGPKAEGGKRSFVGRLLPWIVMVVVVAVCAGAGLGLGRLFAGPRQPEPAEPGSARDESAGATDLETTDDSIEDSENVWYYDLDPVVANLNEPSVTRYVRATLTLQISSDLEKKKGTAILDEKKPILINWLTVYLSSLSLEDIRGDKNLKSIQSHVREAFNEKLFPDSRPQIKQVLIKEFPVQ